MHSICPRCNHPLAGRTECGACGYQVPTSDPRVPRPKLPDGATKWQDTPLTRSLIGLVVAQGVYFGLRQFCTVLILIFASGDAQATFWATDEGVLLKQVLQAVSILIGGALVGATQQRGMIQGMVVGLYNSLVFLMIDFANPAQGKIAIEQIWVLFGQPPLQAFFGAMGGLIGSIIWKPLRPLGETPPPPKQAAPKPKLPRWQPGALDGPVNWPRVLIGASVAVGVTFWASLIFRTILDNLPLKGIHSAETPYQAKLVIWEISMMSLVIGGMVAGANSANGFKQGLIASFITAIALIVLSPRAGGSSLPTQALAFNLLRIDAALNLPSPLDNFLYSFVSVIPLVAGGGWFGSQLMPPITGSHRRVISDY